MKAISRGGIQKASDPAAQRRKLVGEYERESGLPYVAAARGNIDDVILPSKIRLRLIAALETILDDSGTDPRTKHGSLPLWILDTLRRCKVAPRAAASDVFVQRRLLWTRAPAGVGEGRHDWPYGPSVPPDPPPG